jgi:hypothetical protein
MDAPPSLVGACPPTVLSLDAKTFHEQNQNSVMVVGFHRDDASPGWSAARESLQKLATFTNDTVSTLVAQGKHHGVSIVVSSLAKVDAPRLYTQYSVTRPRHHHTANSVFIYMFLPRTPDLPLKVQWDDGGASAHTLVNMLSKVYYRVKSFDVAFKERFVAAVTAGDSLGPLIQEARALIETRADPDTTENANRYLRVMERIEKMGVIWVARELEQITMSLSAGRCGNLRSCLRAWQMKQLLLSFAAELVDDAKQALSDKQGSSLEQMHRDYGVPTPHELSTMTTQELMKLQLELEASEAQLQSDYEDFAEETIEMMIDDAGISPPVTKQRLREAFAHAERDKLEKIRGRMFSKYGKKVHRFLFIRKMHTKIAQFYQRAELHERGVQASSRLNMREASRGAML